MANILDKQAYTSQEIEKMIEIARRVLSARFYQRKHSAHVRAVYQEVVRNPMKYGELLRNTEQNDSQFNLSDELRNTR